MHKRKHVHKHGLRTFILANRFLVLALVLVVCLLVLGSMYYSRSAQPEARDVFIAASYIISDFGALNLSGHVNESLVLVGNVTGQHLFFALQQNPGPFYEFSDANGSTVLLSAAANESFTVGLSYIIVATVVSDVDVRCQSDSTRCGAQYYLLATMRNQ